MKQLSKMLLVAVLMLGVWAIAQTATPVVSDQLKLELRDVQVAYLQHTANLEALKTQYSQEYTAQQAALTKMQAVVDKAFAEAKVSKADYDFDAQTMAFVKKKPASK